MTPLPERVKNRLPKLPQTLRGDSPPVGADHWHTRGYLPHRESWHDIQSVTFRLIDALPAHVVARLAHQVETSEGDAAYFTRLEDYLDAGHGACWLGRPQIAALARDALFFNHEKKYLRHAWVIMPNHVHLLLRPFVPNTLSKILQGITSYTAHEINRVLGRQGPDEKKNESSNGL